MQIGPTKELALSSLRPHPENATIFGDPTESPEFDAILSSVRASGIWEPLIVKADGTILSGHLRRAVAEKLRLKTVPVRVADDFGSYRDEVTFIVRSNADRRQLTKGEIALAFKRLRGLPKEQGGTKRKMGRPAKDAKSSAGRQLSRSDDDAAETLGVKRDEARALETVFTTPGVPDELKRAVNKGTVAPTPAAKAVRAELKRQGDAIKDPSALKAVAAPKPKAAPKTETHEARVAKEAERYQTDYRELFDLYKQSAALLTRRPLKSVIGPTEHHEYAGLIRDVALLFWREIESVQGPTNAGKQMSLTVLAGGRA